MGTLKKSLRRALAAPRPTKQQELILDLYSSPHGPTPYMTKALAKARRRNKLARMSRRANR